MYCIFDWYANGVCALLRRFSKNAKVPFNVLSEQDFNILGANYVDNCEKSFFFKEKQYYEFACILPFLVRNGVYA